MKFEVVYCESTDFQIRLDRCREDVMKQMNKKVRLEKRLLADIHHAQKEFEYYEKMYRSINGDGKQYLQMQSRSYKRHSVKIREIIRPSINKNCPTCINCCRLYSPQFSIYIARTIGGFQFIDYLLVRCNTVLPEPNISNTDKNLCYFWENGCILPDDCRSYLCTQWFCDSLKKELNMEVVAAHLKSLESIINDFSIKKCLGLNRKP